MEKKQEEQVEEAESEEESDQDTQEEETSEDETEEELSLEELREKNRKLNIRLNAANKESKERKLKIYELQKEKQDKEEADLTEKEKSDKRAQEAEPKLAQAQKENHTLKLSQEFGKTARELKLEFVSDTAREDALKLLDPEAIGEDFDGLEDELKKLSKDRPYLFGKPDPNQFINDGSRKSRSSGKTIIRKTIEQKKRRIAPL